VLILLAYDVDVCDSLVEILVPYLLVGSLSMVLSLSTSTSLDFSYGKPT